MSAGLFVRILVVMLVMLVGAIVLTWVSMLLTEGILLRSSLFPLTWSTWVLALLRLRMMSFWIRLCLCVILLLARLRLVMLMSILCMMLIM